MKSFQINYVALLGFDGDQPAYDSWSERILAVDKTHAVEIAERAKPFDAQIGSIFELDSEEE